MPVHEEPSRLRVSDVAMPSMPIGVELGPIFKVFPEDDKAVELETLCLRHQC